MMILEILSQLEVVREVVPVVYESALGLALALASLASAGYGMYEKTKASNELREKQKDNLNSQKTLRDYWLSEANRDFTKTEMAKSALKRIGDQFRSANKKTDDAAAKSGATQESKIAAKSENLKGFNNAMNRIAEHGTNYRNGMYRNYDGMLKDIYTGNADLYGKDVNSWGNFANNSSMALAQSLGTINFK